MLVRGCGCRPMEEKMCHVPCAVRYFQTTLDSPEYLDKWTKCDVCKQQFRGAFMMGLAKKRYESVKDDDIRSVAKIRARMVLAQCHMDEGNPKLALVMLSVLHAELSAAQSDDPLLVDILTDKASALYKLGPTRSKEHTDTLYLILNSGLPKGDARIMEANNQLAMALVRAPNPDASMLDMAETCALSAVAGSKLPPNDNRQNRQITYENNLAAVLAKRGKFKESLDLLARLLVRARLVFGPDHEMSVSVMMNTASFIVQAKKAARYEEAASTMREVYAIRTRILGTEHKDTQDARRLLLGVLRVTGAACARPECDSVEESLNARCATCRVGYCTDKCRHDDSARHAASASCVRKGARKAKK